MHDEHKKNVGRSTHRGWLILGVLGLGVVILGVSVARLLRTNTTSGQVDPARKSIQNGSNDMERLGLREFSVWDSNRGRQTGSQQQTRSNGPIGESRPPGPPTLAGQVNARIKILAESDGEFTDETAENLATLVKELTDMGEAAIPIIENYLRSGEDMSFREMLGGEKAAYPSLRLALINVLVYGPPTEGAIRVGLETVGTSQVPHEIALLAYGLETMAPGQYRDLILDRTKAEMERLTVARGTRPDVVPLFEVLQTYGGSDAIAYIESNAGRLSYYGALALSNLPEGQGVPALIRLASGVEFTGKGRGDFALRPLAQVTVDHADAREALRQFTAENRIPDAAWPSVAAALTGLYIRYGTPVLSTSLPNTQWTPDQLRSQIAFVDQLLATTVSAAGKQSLQNARAKLVAKLESAK